MGEGVVSSVLDALIKDFTGSWPRSEAGMAMAVRTMRAVQAGEMPVDGGTAVQEDPDRPVFRGHGAVRLRVRLRAAACSPPAWTRST